MYLLEFHLQKEFHPTYSGHGIRGNHRVPAEAVEDYLTRLFAVFDQNSGADRQAYLISTPGVWETHLSHCFLNLQPQSRHPTSCTTTANWRNSIAMPFTLNNGRLTRRNSKLRNGRATSTGPLSAASSNIDPHPTSAKDTTGAVGDVDVCGAFRHTNPPMMMDATSAA